MTNIQHRFNSNIQSNLKMKIDAKISQIINGDTYFNTKYNISTILWDIISMFVLDINANTEL